ncbi:class I SAM-dependent methyltransferase [Actinomadura rupiterrae]|uniref:class I SAM-dependent methyltransferase n=1 Tax=Actinomadura rupiterrae TaxID=559627 RepID=UPI0020A4C4E9|nr:class I SAM-dependent methyltransferase [Actinomadura rupiterrae]MCP2337650.1 SAM-dependent methyltransferase [Actinomadura rupiterrae]
MIGELYERALGNAQDYAIPTSSELGFTGKPHSPLYLDDRSGVQIEDASGTRRPLPVKDWLRLRPGDEGLLSRSAGPVLDVGSGPGRLTVTLTERGVLALGIDIAPTAVAMTVAAGGPALVGDVFAQVPGAGLWRTILLADGNIGIGGDPAMLLRRLAQLLAPNGRILAEVNAPGVPSRREQVRLRSGETVGPWFPWAQVAADDLPQCGLTTSEHWEEANRCFVALTP